MTQQEQQAFVAFYVAKGLPTARASALLERTLAAKRWKPMRHNPRAYRRAIVPRTWER